MLTRAEADEDSQANQETGNDVGGERQAGDEHSGDDHSVLAVVDAITVADEFQL